MMKKMIRGIFLVGLVPAGFGISNTVSANPYAPIIHQANQLRISSWCLNDQARVLEIKAQRLPSHTHQYERQQLRQQARQLRQQAKKQALQSNRVAKRAFDRGYIRPDRGGSYA